MDMYIVSPYMNDICQANWIITVHSLSYLLLLTAGDSAGNYFVDTTERGDRG